MEPISTSLLVAGAASIIASLIARILDYLSKYLAIKRAQDITITTNSGERLKIGTAKNLSEERIREIVAIVQRESKRPSAEEE